MKKFLIFCAFPLIAILILIIYSKTLNYYFFQDDWFVLSLVKNVKLTNIWTFFLIRNDVIYYRPFGMQLFFYVAYNLFGLKSFEFHLISLGFHLANVFLISLISFIFLKNKLASLVTAFFYAVANFHFMTLSWLSLTWVNIGTFFAFSSIYFFLNYLKISKNTLYFLFLCTFLIALFTTEFSITIPFVIFILCLLKQKMNLEYLKKILFLLLPSLVIISTYLAVRLIIFHPQTVGDYKIAINPNAFKNIIWYLLWLFGLPQELKFNFMASEFKFSPIFLSSLKNLIWPFFIVWTIWVLAFLLSVLINIRLMILKNLLIFLLTFIFGLLPVIFLPNHTFPYYLNIASLGLFILMGYIVGELVYSGNKLNSFIAIILLLSWFSTSLLNFSISEKTNWIPGESSISYKISNKIYLEKNENVKSFLIISTDNLKASQSLMSQDAAKILLENTNIKTYYNMDKLLADYKIKPSQKIVVLENE